MRVIAIESDITHLQCEVTLVTILDQKSQCRDVMKAAIKRWPGKQIASRAGEALEGKHTNPMGMCSSNGHSVTMFCPDPRIWTSIFIHELRHAVDQILEFNGIPSNTEGAAALMECVHRDLWKPMAKTMCVKEEKPKRRSK